MSDARPHWRARLLPAFLALLGVNLLGLAVWTGPRYWRQRGAAARQMLRSADKVCGVDFACAAAIRQRDPQIAVDGEQADRPHCPVA